MILKLIKTMLNKVFKYLMIVAGVACVSSHALASNVSMYIDNFTIKGGETKTLAINLTNDVEITAFQCDVYLPEGMSFVFNEDEESYNWLNYDRAAKKHVYEGGIQADGALRSLVYHLSSTAFKGNSGEILYFDVKADDNFAGEQTIELKNVECTQPDGSKILPTPTSCTVVGEVEVVNVTSVSLDKTSASITLGETVTLTATVLPDNATDKSVAWSSSDETIATVDNGVVTAVAPGVVTITVTTADGSNLSATCEVEVLPILVASISLDQTTASINPGETVTLTATVLPDNATDKSVAWSSSDETIATVDNGVVTAVAPGVATITVTTADGTNLSATCEVEVIAPAVEVNVSMYIDNFTIKGGETKTLAINLTNNVDITAFQCDVYLPEGMSFVFNEDEESYNWLNYDRAAKKHVYEGGIQADGALRSLVYHLSSTAFKGNSGEILYFDVKADDNFVGEHTIELKNVECTQPDGTKVLPTPTSCIVIGEATNVNATSISLDKTRASIALGETVTLTATVLPDNATDKSVTWSSSDESIATVDNGVVTAVAPGVATITATTVDGTNLSATCEITISNELTLTLIDGEGGKFELVEQYGKEKKVKMVPTMEWEINTVTFNGEDVTNEIDDEGVLTVSLVDNSVINVVYEKVNTSVQQIEMNSGNLIRIYVKDDTVNVVGAEEDSNVMIFGVDGLNIYNGNEKTISIDERGVYILTVDNRTFKFAM